MAQGSESDYRLLPSFIASTRWVLNPRNRDLKSFGHAIIFAHHLTDWRLHRGRPAKESRFHQHSLNSIKYPVLPNDISTLEERLWLRINLFSFEDALGYKRFAMYISKTSFKMEINLLFWNGRYAWIKHFSRLFCDTTK